MYIYLALIYTCVYTVMAFKIVIAYKRLLTLITFVWFLARVPKGMTG